MERRPTDGRDGPADDVAAAGEARARIRRQGLIRIEPDPQAVSILRCGEDLFTVRRDVRLERRQPPTRPGVPGDLYLTSERLVLTGPSSVDIPLDQIRDTGIAGDRLLLVLRGGRGVAIETDSPRLLRVEIAAARAAARSRTGTAASVEVAEPGGGLGSVADAELVDDAADVVLDGPR